MKFPIIIVACAVGLLPLAVTAATSQVDYVSMDTTLKDNLGNPLSAGGNPDGDGAILQVGYFLGGTANFAGTWVAITGLGSANSSLLTSVGDGGDATTLGIFSGTVIFDPAVNGSLPAGGTQLAIRFYNGTSINGSTHYNTVTSLATSWQFQTPSTPAPTPPTSLDMDVGSLVWEGGAGSAFTTAILIPEPGVAMLGMFGGLLLLRRRRA
jgi:hypothetical protein